MLTLSPALTTWKNATSREVPLAELYELELPDGSFVRLVAGNPTGTGSLTYEGNVYTAAAINRTEEWQSVEGDLPTVRLEVTNINRVAGGYCEKFELGGQRVTLTRVLISTLTTVDAFPQLYTVGTVRYSSTAATFELSQVNLFRRQAPFKQYQRIRCKQEYVQRFVDGNGCAYPSDNFDEDKAQDIALQTTDNDETAQLFGWYAVNALRAKPPSSILARITPQVAGLNVHGNVPGALYIGSTQADVSWSATSRRAPYLFKRLAGDFDVFTRVDILDSRPGLRAGILCWNTVNESLSSWIMIGRAEITDDVFGVRVSSATSGVGDGDTIDQVSDRYLRLRRVGNVFDAYRGTAYGGPWTLVSSRTITMASTVRIGLAVSAPVLDSRAVSAAFPFLQFRAGGLSTCSRLLDDANGCRAHSNTPHFLAFLGTPADMMLSTYSSMASFFPTLEIEYGDMLLGWPYRLGGRGSRGIDCLGVAIEIYRRAGVVLPDPAVEGQTILDFAERFAQVEAPDRLYDLISLQHRQPESGLPTGQGGSAHVEVVVRQEYAITARAGRGVHLTRIGALRALPGAEFWRVKGS